MTHHSDALRLRHMREYAREALEMARGKSRPDLDADRQLNLALVRLLEIVGEAAGRVSDETRQRHPEIPWLEITNLRNRLIHGYDDVDFDILWQILADDLPPLVVQLNTIVESL